MLNKTDKEAIEKTIGIIQKEIYDVFKQYEKAKFKNFHLLEHSCDRLHLLIECRNRLKNYFGLN